jgi:hypothetical protein
VDKEDAIMSERTIDDAIDEIVDSVEGPVADLMAHVLERETRDRFNPQGTTPHDYAVMAWNLHFDGSA